MVITSIYNNTRDIEQAIGLFELALQTLFFFFLGYHSCVPAGL
jgi:hypothetical protein